MVCTWSHESGMLLLGKRELLGVHCMWKMCVFIVTSVQLHLKDSLSKHIFHMIQKEFSRLIFHSFIFRLILILHFIFELPCTKHIQYIHTFNLYVRGI